MQKLKCSSLARKAMWNGAIATALVFGISGAHADQPGRGATRSFEVNYLKFIIDHHFSALRMTELVAGTDTIRDAQISSNEGTSPTPSSASTPAKSRMDEIKSMARKENRAQREEIMTAQRFLKEWYGVTYDPRLRASGRQLIAGLENAAPGATFDQTFLRLFSRHHYLALKPTVQCITGADVAHIELERYCRDIFNMQTSGIDEMRHMLCKKYSDCDYQPFNRAAIGRNESEFDWTEE